MKRKLFGNRHMPEILQQKRSEHGVRRRSLSVIFLVERSSRAVSSTPHEVLCQELAGTMIQSVGTARTPEAPLHCIFELREKPEFQASSICSTALDKQFRQIVLRLP